MQNKQVIETYNQGPTDYDAIMQRYWHVGSPAYPAEVQVTGVDVSHGMLSRAQEKQVSASVTLKVTDLENLLDTGIYPL